MAGKTVYVELIAQTRKFNAGMKKAEKGLKRVKVAVGLVSAAILAVGAVALRQFSNGINRISEELDTLAKTARALGTEFNFLEDLQFIGKRLGADASASTVKKTMLAISKATAEAASGSAEYVDEFKALGINVKEFEKLDPEAKFYALQNAYSASAKGAAEQNALQIIAGRGAKALLNIFDAETESIEALIEERRKLGGFTKQAGDLAETFEDVKTNTDQVIRGLKNDIFLAIGPIFLDAAKATQKFVLWLKETGMTGTFVKGVLLTIIALMGAATTALIALSIPLIAAAAPFLALGAAIVGLVAGLGTLIYYWDDLKRSIRDFGDVAGPILDKVSSFGGEVLSLLGFGGDGSMAQNAASAAPRATPVNFGGPTPQVASTVNNYYVAGNSQVEKSLQRKGEATRRGKTR